MRQKHWGAVFAALGGLALAGLADGPAQAQCHWVPCPPSAAPGAASTSAAGSQRSWSASSSTVIRGSSTTVTVSGTDGFLDEDISETRAAPQRRPAARAPHRSGRSHTASARRSAGTGAHHRSARSTAHATARTGTRTVARPHSAPTLVWQPTIRDHASAYGAASTGPSVSLSSFAGRGERWESSSGYRIVWTGPAQPVWSGGQLCGWGDRSQWQGSQMVQQAPAWVCQCAEGWRPPGH